MQFAALAETFEKLEKTPKRLEMTDILADLFKKATTEDVDKIIYLLQGRVRPAFEDVEIGVGEKFVIQAIVKSTGFTEKEVEKQYQKLGDLGLTAEHFISQKKQKALFTQPLTVKHVYENFMKMATSSGSGSQDLKIKLLVELLNNSSPLEARFIARIPIDKLRLGVGDPTVLDALSVYSAGDKSLRERLERGYDVSSDLGLVAKTLYSKGLEGVDHIEMKVDQPLMPALCERLPSADEIIKKLGKCAAEHKYDGIRCISGYTELYEKDNGLMPARDIRKWHYVLTHRGNFKKVIGISKRIIDKNERVFEFQTYLGNPFKITEKHRVLKFENGVEKWVSVEKIKTQDWVVFPVPTFKVEEKFNSLKLTSVDNYCKKFKIDNNFFRFLGYWLGDGYSNTHNKTFRVGLVLNEKDKRLIKEYEEIVRKNLGITKISKNKHNGAIYLYWTDRQFLKWLSKNFRKPDKKEWKGKAIPEWMNNATKKQFESFLQGWTEADGHVNNELIKITTKEKQVAARAQLICLKNRIACGIKKFRVKNKDYYNLIIPKTAKKAKIQGNRLLVKVMRNNELRRRHPRGVDPRQVVYNLQIEKDESYCTTTVALHNCQIHKKKDNVQIFSRRLENITHMFPDVVSEVKKQVKANEIIFDAEALSYNELTEEYLPFQQTMQRKRKYDIKKMSEQYPLRVFAFDVMFLNGKNLTTEPYIKRRKILNDAVGNGEKIRLSDQMTTDSAEELTKYFDDAVSRGLEGIIAKDLNAPYTTGARKFSWIKLKRSYSGILEDTIDVVIIGYYLGKGKRTDFGFGGLLTAVYDEDEEKFKTIARVGSGFSEEQMKELSELLGKVTVKKKPKEVDSLVEPDKWVEPRYVVEVNADEITESPMHTAGMKKSIGYALRFPRMVKYRFDKSPEQATTVSEIIKMHKNQKRTKLEE